MKAALAWVAAFVLVVVTVGSFVSNAIGTIDGFRWLGDALGSRGGPLLVVIGAIVLLLWATDRLDDVLRPEKRMIERAREEAAARGVADATVVRWLRLREWLARAETVMRRIGRNDIEQDAVAVAVADIDNALQQFLVAPFRISTTLYRHKGPMVEWDRTTSTASERVLRELRRTVRPWHVAPDAPWDRLERPIDEEIPRWMRERGARPPV